MGILSSDVKEVKIVLDPKQGRSFFPGEVMKGKVILVTEKDDIKLQKLTTSFDESFISTLMNPVESILRFKLSLSTQLSLRKLALKALGLILHHLLQ